MPVEYVPVAEEEGEEAIEVPTEDNSILLLSTLTAQFPGVIGLKYRNPVSNTFRAVRMTDGMLHRPPELDCWAHSGIVYVCNFPKDNKRKGDDGLENPTFKAKKPDRKKCCDLIVLGLPYKCTESDLKSYFAKYGDLVMTQVKRDFRGESRGYGFIRFAEYESQLECIQNPRHHIEGRWCEVKVPNSQGEATNDSQLSRKVFVGRVTEELTQETIKDFFNQYGTVTEVFIPKPFRAFAFVTFADADSAEAVVGEDFIVDGVSVHVSAANPKYHPNMGMMGGGAGGRNINMSPSGMPNPSVGGPPGPMNQMGRRQGPPVGGAAAAANSWNQSNNNPSDPYGYTAAMVNSLVNNPNVLAAALAQVSNMSVNGSDQTGGGAPGHRGGRGGYGRGSGGDSSVPNYASGTAGQGGYWN